MKEIKMFGATCLAEEVLRDVIGLQTGQKVQFEEKEFIVDANTKLTQPRPHELKELVIRGWIRLGEKKAVQMYARIELSNYHGPWQTSQIFFYVRPSSENERVIWYRARSYYAGPSSEDYLRVRYPDLLQSIEDHCDASEWNVGTSREDRTGVPHAELEAFVAKRLSEKRS